MRTSITVILFLTFSSLTWGQRNFDSISLALPVDIPVSLSANFGELRPNHYHMGIDFKTQSVVGKNILSVEDGYISRIRISPYGYGKALYITHPNGLVTVYGHLLSFSSEIEDYLLKYQLENKSSVIDFDVPKGDLPVKKSQFVAFSGNTGGSFGPHLHFEVRDAVTEKCYNPFLFYPQIKDRTKPSLYRFAVYPIDENSTVNGKASKIIIKPVNNGGGNYSYNIPVKVSGKIGVGVQLQDFMTDFPHKFGLYNVKMFVDDELVYEHQLDTLSFDGQRYINSLLDYEHYTEKRAKIQKLFVEPNNMSEIYDVAKQNGILSKDNGKVQVKCIAEDFHENKVTLSFNLKFVVAKEQAAVECDDYIKYSEEGKIKNDYIEIVYGKDAFYTDYCFQFDVDSTYVPRKAESPVYKIHDKTTPIHESLFLKIKNIPEIPSIQSKLVLARVSKQNKLYGAGGWNDGSTYYAEINKFGKYVLAFDTIAPRITPVSKITGRTFSQTSKLTFKVTDDLSGVSQFWATIDGKFVPLEYDGKSRRMFLYLKKEFFDGGKQKRELKIIALDERENKAVYQTYFYK